MAVGNAHILAAINVDAVAIWNHEIAQNTHAGDI